MRRIPLIVQEVLNEYIGLLNERIPNTMEGLYIHGSIALDAYVNNSSDIDFITITNRRLTEEEVAILSDIHETIASKYKKPEMDGVYILWEDLGELYASANENNINYPYYNSGKMNLGAYFNFNPITWSQLKKNGITLIGPEPATFRFEIKPEQLTSYVLENMNTYWAGRVQWIENSVEEILNIPTEDIELEIEWSILGLLRQYYTLKEHDIISKLGAGEYGLLHIPKEWHNIIKEAINIRKGVKGEIFNSDEERVDAALKFSKYLISFCNSTFSHNKITS
jgi:hypothetical protein